jgi:hypothetical protein
MPLPATRYADNLRLIGHHTLDGAPNTGEGLAMKIAPDGRRFLYVAGVHAPMAMSILDVTDPAAPELVWQLPCAHDEVRGNCLTLSGDTLLLANQTDRVGMEPAGFFVFDISRPDRPEQMGFFDSSGPHSKGVHFVAMMDGRYAHIASGAADFEPNHPADHQFYMIVDLADRSAPREVGRWWVPGQRKGEAPLVRHPVFDHAFRAHHTLSFPQRPDRAYLGYIDAGIVILDIADKANPKLVTRVDYHPPMNGFTHTVVPLFDRELLLVTEEALKAENDWPKRYWLVDHRMETNLVMMSSFPVPAGFDDWQREGGRIGAHNIHENHPEPGSATLVNTCVATWFSAGIRIYDIRDPFTPKEIAGFVPETPGGQKGCRINDVFVDNRGIIYAGDRINGGIYILEYDGPIPLD